MNVISSQILQFVSQPAFLTILTQNHLCGKKKKYATSIEPQTDDSSLAAFQIPHFLLQNFDRC